jgi:serine phosphatase RsbU (regulator of sigma subunit)/uncharacterized protein HemY
MIPEIRYTIVLAFAIFFNAVGQNIDSLKQALKNAKHDTIRCRVLSTMVEAENDDLIWPQYNEQLLMLSESKLKTTSNSASEYLVYQKYYADALNNIGYLANIQGNRTKAFEYFEKSLRVREKLGEKHGIAESLSNIGSVYESQGDPHKALEYHRRSLKIREETGDKKGIAGSLASIGLLYKNQGDIANGLNYQSKSLKIREEIGDKVGTAYSLDNIGELYNSQGDLSKGLDYQSRSLKIRQEIGDKNGMATSLSNIGVVYHNMGDTTKALEFYDRSLKMSEEIGDKEGIAYCLQHIGVVAANRGDLTKALFYQSRSLKIREEIGDKKGMCRSLNQIGNLYLKQKNYSKALAYTSRSMQTGRELGYPLLMRNAAEQLSKIYRTTGNYQLALENYELYIQMRDSINNIETQKATIKQQSKYEYEKQKALEDEKHVAELKIQEEKAQARKKSQNAILGSVSLVLVIVVFFSVMLYNRFKTTQKQKQIIEKKEKETQEQKFIIEEKQKEILDSINYAKRIQYTLLAHDAFLKENLPEHFIFFMPKDIVSGDFYWAAKKDHCFYLAVCDSTGHGVPGAFMSLLNIGFLSEAIIEKHIKKPNEVFDYVREKLTSTISKEGQRDGFDGILMCFDQKNKTITYAAANNAPLLIHNDQLVELPFDRMPVGIGERKEQFTLNTIQSFPGDLLYLYTDGYADQFGGAKGKKFKYKQLNELLLAQQQKHMAQQQQDLKNVFNNWRGELEQVDDVCVVGIKL